MSIARPSVLSVRRTVSAVMFLAIAPGEIGIHGNSHMMMQDRNNSRAV